MPIKNHPQKFSTKKSKGVGDGNHKKERPRKDQKARHKFTKGGKAGDQKKKESGQIPHEKIGDSQHQNP